MLTETPSDPCSEQCVTPDHGYKPSSVFSYLLLDNPNSTEYLEYPPEGSLHLRTDGFVNTHPFRHLVRPGGAYRVPAQHSAQCTQSQSGPDQEEALLVGEGAADV